MRRWFCILLMTAAAYAANDPGPDQVPEWAQQGKFRFARLDGGPIEIMKTARSAWGMHFTDREKEVLGNLYSKYGDRMVERLREANLNWVWITWSVGYSWQQEAEQREQCRRMIEKLHAGGIRVTAYMCAASMFWESMFRDEPRSVRWLKIDPDGVPFRYSGGRDPLRFIADVSGAEWVEYQKRRIGAAIDAGIDAIFFDNTSSAAWNSNEEMEAFIAKLRRFIDEEKRAKTLLLTNYGLTPGRIGLNRNMDVIFAEYWREPGVWGEDWDASNVRRSRYMRGVIPEWKSLITEYSQFHTGTRATGFLNPRSARLAIAEAAAFRSGYAWDMEGPFDERIMTGDAAAMETWKAIGHYNGFLKDHEELYWKATNVTPVAVLLSEKRRRGAGISFGWEREESGLFDALSKASVLYQIRLAGTLDDTDLSKYAVVIVPDVTELTPPQQQMLERYRASGGKVAEAKGAGDIDKVRSLAPGAVSVKVEGAPHVIANVTRLATGRLAVHLLNYDPAPVSNVTVRLNLGEKSGAEPRLVTPDAGTKAIRLARRSGTAVEFTLESLDQYAVAVIE